MSEGNRGPEIPPFMSNISKEKEKPRTLVKLTNFNYNFPIEEKKKKDEPVDEKKPVES